MAVKNTKYLFDESTSPAWMVSVSQLQTYLSCKKKWEYNYIENLKPRVERSYLTIGKLCHKGMQVAMQTKWYSDTQVNWGEDYDVGAAYSEWLHAGIYEMRDEWDSYIAGTDFLDEELPELDQLLEDAISVFTQAFEEFEPWKYEILTLRKNGEDIPALELHFRVPCPPTKGLHGYIDAILLDTTTGSMWCVDYKFRKSLSPDEDEAFNIQNAVYSYACLKMGIPVTGTLTWQHVNTPAAEPQLLKNGGVSRSKIKTTWKKYAQFCLDHAVDPELYREEMQEKLADIEWYRATYEYRNPETVGRIWLGCVVPAARQVKAAYGKKADNFRSLYPWNCKMCQFQSLCQGELRGYDAQHIRLSEYTVRPHARCDNKAIDRGIDDVV